MSTTDSGRQFFVVDLEHEDFKGTVGPFSSREAAERWSDQLVIDGLYVGTSGSSQIIPLHGPVEAEDLIRSRRAERERINEAIIREHGTPEAGSQESFASKMGHPGGMYF